MLYLKTDRKFKTLEDFFKYLYGGDWYNGTMLHPTYSDEKCENSQCSANRLRSYTDLQSLVKTYFPTVSEEDFIKFLIGFRIQLVETRLIRVSSENKLDNKYYLTSRFYYCYYIEDITFGISAKNNLSFYNKPSFLRWLEVFKKIGITNKKELINYMSKIPNYPVIDSIY